MSTPKFLSQDEWNAKKAESIKNEPATKVLSIAQLGLANDSLNKNYVLIDGKQVAVTDTFWQNLAKCLGINAQLLSKVNSVDKERVIASALLDGLKRILSSAKSRTHNLITVHGDAGSNRLTHVNPGGVNRLTNKGLFEQAEILMNKYNYLVPRDVDSKANGNTSIQLVSTNEMAFSKVGEDEVFNFGFSLGNNGNMTQLGNFIYRLVCSNGMMGLKTAWDYTMKGVSETELLAMQSYIHDSARNLFVPDKFSDNLSLANVTKASFNEVDKAYHWLTGRIDESQDANLKDHAKFVLGDKHIFGYNQTHARIKAKGFDPNELTPKQKERISTNMTVWDLVNAMTYIGSHDIGFAMNGRERAAREGGRIFYGDYDLAYNNFLD